MLGPPRGPEPSVHRGILQFLGRIPIQTAGPQIRIYEYFVQRVKDGHWSLPDIETWISFELLGVRKESSPKSFSPNGACTMGFWRVQGLVNVNGSQPVVRGHMR